MLERIGFKGLENVCISYIIQYVHNFEFRSNNTVRLQGKSVFQSQLSKHIILNLQQEMLVFVNYHSDDISTNNALILVNMDE